MSRASNSSVFSFQILHVHIWQMFLSKSYYTDFKGLPGDQTHDLGVAKTMLYCLSYRNKLVAETFALTLDVPSILLSLSNSLQYFLRIPVAKISVYMVDSAEILMGNIVL